jgi:hypothetical protein
MGMNRAEYLCAVNEFFYQGEVLGEAFFGRCLELETDPARRYKWANLQQLETETKARLRPFLMRLGISLVQKDVSGQIAEFTDGFAQKSWAEHMEGIAGVTDFYLGKFREIEAAAPTSERDMAKAMVAHEVAINNFAKRELAGDPGNSLSDVVDQLHWPIAPPA